MERISRSGAERLKYYAILFLVGYAAASTATSARHRHQADERVAAVQEHNAQLADQLSASMEVTGLILDDESSSFIFTSTESSGDPVTCEGSYVVEDGVAQSTGELACTTVVAVD